MSVDMKDVLAVKAELGGDISAVKRELKRLQSARCRLKKQKSRADYQARMTELVQREQLVKEVRAILEPKKVAVPDFTEADVKRLDYEETMKAIKSIQSKKCLSQENEAEYQKAVAVEAMLLEHKRLVKPADNTAVKKSELAALLENLKSLTPAQAGKTAIQELEKLIG